MANETESIKLLIEGIYQAQAAMAKGLADLDRFDAGSRKAAEGAKTLTTHSTEAHGALAKIGDIAKEIAGPLIALFTIEKMIEFTKGALEAAEAMGKLGEETGLSIKQLNAWSNAADKHNVTQQQLRISLDFAAKSMATLSDPASTLSRLMVRMGIDVRDANKEIKPFPELLELIRGKMVGYEASSSRAAAVTEIFGRGGARMMGVMKDVNTETDKAVSFTDQHTEAAEKLQRIFAELTKIGQVLVLDAITPLIGKTGELIGADGKLTSAGDNVRRSLSGVVDVLKTIIDVMSRAIGLVADYYRALGALSVAVEMWFKGGSPVAAVKDVVGHVKGMAQDVGVLPSATGGAASMAGASVEDVKNETEQKKKLADDMFKSVEFQMKQAHDARQTREEEYKQALLLTQQQEERGLITKSEEETRNIAAAKKLDDGLKEIIKTLGELNQKYPTEGKALGLNARIANLQTEEQGAGFKASAPGPGDIGQALKDFNKSLDGMQDKSKLVATTLNATLRPAIDGISKGIYNSMIGAQSWGKTFMQVGAQIVQSLISIGVQMIASALIEIVAHKMVSTVKKTEGMQATITGSMKAAESVASIPYVGPVLAIAAQAAFMAMGMGAMAAFDEGGYTGDKGRRAVAGVVHGQEVVIPAPIVAALGPAHFARYWPGGKMPGYEAGGFVAPTFTPPPALSGQGTTNFGMHVAIVNTRQDQREFSAKEGWKVVVDQLTKRSNVFKA